MSRLSALRKLNKEKRTARGVYKLDVGMLFCGYYHALYTYFVNDKLNFTPRNDMIVNEYRRVIGQYERCEVSPIYVNPSEEFTSIGEAWFVTKYLLEIIEILPDVEFSTPRKWNENLYFKSKDGEGILCPLKRSNK